MRLQITRAGLEAKVSGDERLRCRALFARRHLLRLPRLIEPEFLRLLARRLGARGFRQERIQVRRAELPREDGPRVTLLFHLNDPRLLRAVSALTGVGPLRSFVGQVARFRSGRGHELVWHNDLVDGRRLALSVNLGPAPYRGGLLELRESGSRRVVGRAANPVAGSALLFRVSPRLEHRNTPVKGRAPKTVLAGWFLEGALPRLPGERLPALFPRPARRASAG